MWQERFHEFVTLFLVIDPIAVVPSFLVLTEGMKARDKHDIAVRAVVIAFAVLTFFIFAGSFLLEHMGVPLRAFQIAGGIVLFIVALDMIRGEQHAPSKRTKDSHTAIATYPLAIPKMAGPGAMLAVVFVSDDDRGQFTHQFETLISLGAVMLVQLALLLAAVPLLRLVGPAATSVASRVMGLLLAALAVSMVLTGLGEWLNLPKL